MGLYNSVLFWFRILSFILWTYKLQLLNKPVIKAYFPEDRDSYQVPFT